MVYDTDPLTWLSEKDCFAFAAALGGAIVLERVAAFAVKTQRIG